ncbi:Splicing regulatory glutamine/lysine-rich protein like [Actinidia chinensis var. chinensis]|uniref:Splicing regulatory glutamine/lysine-rich protein like n=1 Tax=Actinidia chinensis var. chinensis TaxID=1590841 RepID=A0A2R6PUC9_ACTCC|nr:Splicing regulatory glutamine/lysine-rich protein like [Actinidia chinensis var. chinensis]
MEYLIKQRRVRFSRLGENSKEGTDSIREDKKGQSWLQRPFSSQMGLDYDSYESEFATAVAAAAFAIHSVEQESLEYQKKMKAKVEIQRKKEDSFRTPPESGHLSRRSSGKEAKDAVEASTRKRMDPENRASRSSFESQRGNSTSRRNGESRADSWERAAMANIRKRYEKMNSRILAWENEKKMKAKLDMERKKRELELRRELNQQHYQSKLARIDHIAGGARVQMEEKRRNEESEVRDRAKRVRSSRKVPFSCFCF